MLLPLTRIFYLIYLLIGKGNMLEVEMHGIFHSKQSQDEFPLFCATLELCLPVMAMKHSFSAGRKELFLNYTLTTVFTCSCWPSGKTRCWILNEVNLVGYQTMNFFMPFHPRGCKNTAGSGVFGCFILIFQGRGLQDFVLLFFHLRKV